LDVADQALITGGAGFLGYHLARRLLDDGWTVVLVDDLSRGRMDAELLALLDDVRFVERDLRIPLAATELGTGYRAVFHLAGIVGVARTTSDPAAVLRTNLLTTMNVVDWCTAIAPEAVFLASTSEVGDGVVASGLSGLPVAESAPAVFCEPLRPRSAYGISKLACELLVAHGSGRGGYRARVARYHNVYGPRMGHSHVIPELIGRIASGQDPLVVYGASQSRAFCHVRDAVEATVRLVEYADPGSVLANVGNDLEELTIKKLAEQLLDLSGVSVGIDAQPAPDGSPERRLPDLSVLRRLTAYEPKVPLADGLKECVGWYVPALRNS
jgi:UDP-glucose 4-epimerase/UDP-glucuronate decarboxylase